MIDSNNPVVQLCAAAMTIDGDPAAARALFQQAWELRRDDFDASIAAHYLARHQSSPSEALHWNQVALEHALAVPGAGAHPLLASLYLNLADSYLALGHTVDATSAVDHGIAALALLPCDGYRSFIERGLEHLRARLRSPHSAQVGGEMLDL